MVPDFFFPGSATGEQELPVHLSEDRSIFPWISGFFITLQTQFEKNYHFLKFIQHFLVFIVGTMFLPAL